MAFNTIRDKTLYRYISVKFYPLISMKFQNLAHDQPDLHYKRNELVSTIGLQGVSFNIKTDN